MFDDFIKYTKSKEFKDLLARYEQALKDNNDEFFDADDLLDIAEYYHMKNDIDAASRAAEYCIELYPNNEKALVFLAKCSIMQGDIENAKRINATLPDSNEPDVILLKAEIMLIDLCVVDADNYLHYIYNNVDEEDCDVELFPLDVAILFCDYNQWEYAERWLMEIKEQEIKDDPDYLETLARIYTNTNRYQEAIPVWTKFLDTNAFSGSAWVNLAQCQYQTGRCVDSLSSAEYANAISAQLPEAYIAMGNAHFALGRNTEAINDFERFLDLCPEDPQGELLLAAVMFTDENYDEARKHIEVAIKGISHLTEEDIPLAVLSETYRQAAFICSAQGDINQALHYLDEFKSLGIDEDSTKLLRAAIYIEAHKVQEGFEVINEILSHGSHDNQTYIRIAMLLIDANFHELGYKLLLSAHNIMKMYGEECNIGYDRLAYATLILGKYDEFLSALESSIKYNPTETVTIFSPFFPEGMPLDEYLDYARKNKIKAPTD